MTPISYIAKYRELIRSFGEAKHAYLGEHWNSLASINDEYDIPRCVSPNPNVLKAYYELRELKQQIKALEAGRDRIVKAVEYCLKSVKPLSMMSREEYQAKIKPFQHWATTMALNETFPFEDPRMSEIVAEQAANNLFDLCGGEFCAAQVEHRADGGQDRLTIYLIK